MRVDDEIRDNAILCPRHVFLGVGDANGALLPMPTGKLVSHLGYPDRPHLHTAEVKMTIWLKRYNWLLIACMVKLLHLTQTGQHTSCVAHAAYSKAVQA